MSKETKSHARPKQQQPLSRRRHAHGRTARRSTGACQAVSSLIFRTIVGRNERRIADPPVLASTLDALVAVLVQPDKVLPHRLLPLLHHVPFGDVLKPLFQPPDGGDVEFVLVRFQVAELGEVLAAVVQLASVGLCGRVHDLVRSDVSVLGEGLAADVAVVGSFAGVSSFVGLEVAELAEALATCGFFAEKGLDTCMCTGVNVEMCLLVERFVAAGDCALISFLGSGLTWRG